MTFILQCLILCIGLGVFILQHYIKRHISIIASRLVYWTTLLFMGIIFNRLLFELYPYNYSISNYYTKENLVILASLAAGYIILQLASPSDSTWKLFNKLSGGRIRVREREESYQSYYPINSERNAYLKELHFETFLETICWLGFVFALIIEALVYVMAYVPEILVVFEGLKDTVCLIMILSIPIALRQIIFYLYRIRQMREEENLTEIEIRFERKLRKQNMHL